MNADLKLVLFMVVLALGALAYAGMWQNRDWETVIVAPHCWNCEKELSCAVCGMEQ